MWSGASLLSSDLSDEAARLSSPKSLAKSEASAKGDAKPKGVATDGSFTGADRVLMHARFNEDLQPKAEDGSFFVI